jgi:hypothetical protein
MPLALELLTTGPNAHGYGRLGDGRNFAFRVRNRKARLEIYRAGADAAEPEPADVELVAERSTGRVNLDSQRSIQALLPCLAVDAEPEPEPGERTLRAYLCRVDSIMDGWADANADASTSPDADPTNGNSVNAADAQARAGRHRRRGARFTRLFPHAAA